jgi:hypothetical protein
MKLLINCLAIISIICACVKTCPDEAKCRECLAQGSDGKFQCSYCENSFLDSVSGLCAVKVSSPVEHCNNYMSQDTLHNCDQCELGFYIDGNNLCTKCPFDDNCALCTQNACTACFNKMIVDPSTNKCISDKYCETKDCAICTSSITSEECRRCDIGFTLDLATYQCHSGLPDCITMDKAGDTSCLRCDYNFYITKEGTCNENPPRSAPIWMLWLLLGFFLLALFGYLGYKCSKKQHDNSDGYLNA